MLSLRRSSIAHLWNLHAEEKLESCPAGTGGSSAGWVTPWHQSLSARCVTSRCVNGLLLAPPASWRWYLPCNQAQKRQNRGGYTVGDTPLSVLQSGLTRYMENVKTQDTKIHNVLNKQQSTGKVVFLGTYQSDHWVCLIYRDLLAYQVHVQSYILVKRRWVPSLFLSSFVNCRRLCSKLIQHPGGWGKTSIHSWFCLQKIITCTFRPLLSEHSPTSLSLWD